MPKEIIKPDLEEKELQEPSKEQAELASMEGKKEEESAEKETASDKIEIEKMDQDTSAQKGPVPTDGQDEATPQPKSPTMLKVESVLEEDLGEIFFDLDEAHQKEFQQVGEQTASKIAQLIDSAKATAGKVFELIRRWLRIIPSIDKFYLEQEAKIKTDRIMNLTRSEEKVEE